jgi:hypothetical protein
MAQNLDIVHRHQKTTPKKAKEKRTLVLSPVINNHRVHRCKMTNDEGW